MQESLTPRHPSQLYEAFLEGMVLFTILWFVRTRSRQPNGNGAGHTFASFDEAARVQAVVEAVMRSDATGTWVDVNDMA